MWNIVGQKKELRAGRLGMPTTNYKQLFGNVTLFPRPLNWRIPNAHTLSIWMFLDNIVVCQFDKIQRVRNKWRFYLKDGIMHLNGKDYVFQKATGEGEW